jgi:pimeloyl-ACP methyl ester carboxylesterase
MQFITPDVASMKKRSRSVLVVGSLAIAFAAILFGAGEVLIAPATAVIGSAPLDLDAQSVTLESSPGESISGWFSSGSPGLGAVLLLHGVRSDRRQMLERARFLHNAGYAVLLIDLPAHGESSGAHITFGFREAEGVRASLQFLKKTLPNEKTAVIGVSLGAASIVLADVTPSPSAVVLESMYPTIEEAVADRLRLRLGSLGAGLAPLLVFQLPIRLGITSSQLRPIDHLASLHAPILVASGTEDLHTTVVESKGIFDAAMQPKEIWLVEGAGHVDLYRFNPKAYETKVFGFLAKYLRNAN